MIRDQFASDVNFKKKYTEIVVNRNLTLLSYSVFILATTTAIQASPPAKLALMGGRIIPVVGKEIAKGTILIEHGKITAIGEKVDIPYDAMSFDVSGKVLFPGMIDPHSSRGLDVPNENFPVTPFLDVYDAMDPSRLYFEDALRDGITSVHVIVANNCVIGGLSRVVHPIGLTPDEMTLKPQAALKLSVAPKRGSDRMIQMATLRETFLELNDYLENLAEEKYEKSLEEKDEKIDVGPEEARKRGKKLIKTEDFDDKHRNLIKLSRGEMDAFTYCELASDVSRAIKLAGDNGFADRNTFVLGTDCFKATDEIKSSGRPVVLDPELLHRERDSLTGKLKETFVPKVFADKGIRFSLQPDPDNSLAERYLNYQAARCVRNGIKRETALEAITLNPAKALGLADKVGSLEVGKIANIVVFSGDPLDFNSWVDQVYIKGIKAYDRENDVRLKQLLGDEPDEVTEKDSPDGDDGDDNKENSAKDSPAAVKENKTNEKSPD